MQKAAFDLKVALFFFPLIFNSPLSLFNKRSQHSTSNLTGERNKC